MIYQVGKTAYQNLSATPPSPSSLPPWRGGEEPGEVIKMKYHYEVSYYQAKDDCIIRYKFDTYKDALELVRNLTAAKAVNIEFNKCEVRGTVTRLAQLENEPGEALSALFD